MPADIDSLFEDDGLDFDETIENEPQTGEMQDDGFEDMFRQQAARSESSQGDLAFEPDEEFLEEESASGGGGFSLGNFSPVQRLILLVLILLDILAIGFGVLVYAGQITF